MMDALYLHKRNICLLMWGLLNMEDKRGVQFSFGELVVRELPN